MTVRQQVWAVACLLLTSSSLSSSASSSSSWSLLMTPRISSLQYPSVCHHKSSDEAKVLERDNTTSTKSNSSPSTKRVTCQPRGADDVTEDQSTVVMASNATVIHQLLSSASLPNVTNRTEMAPCTLILFYANWCPFSALAASHFNALARLFSTNITFVAVDSYWSQSSALNAQFGILAFPAVILFHNGKSMLKYNGAKHDLEHMAEFLSTYTGQKPVGPLEVLDVDVSGPVPTTASYEPDYPLYLAWLFVFLCSFYWFSQSPLFKSCCDTVKRAWVEAELQHEHQE